MSIILLHLCYGLSAGAEAILSRLGWTSALSDQQLDFIKPGGPCPSNVKKTSQIKVKVNKQSLMPFPGITLILQVPLCIEKFLAS